MSWPALLDLIADEVGREVATRIERRAREEFGGLRITIAKRPVITPTDIDAAAPGRPKEAAKLLGVHHSTIYRTLQRGRIIR